MLDLSLGMLLTTAVTFLVLLFLLNSVLYKPLLTFMAKRDESIRRDLENASRNSSDVGTYLAEADKLIIEAKAEASKIREVALSEAKGAAATRIAQKKEQLEAAYATFAAELDSEKRTLKASLLAQMPLFKESVKIKLGKL